MWWDARPAVRVKVYMLLLPFAWNARELRCYWTWAKVLNLILNVETGPHSVSGLSSRLQSQLGVHWQPSWKGRCLVAAAPVRWGMLRYQRHSEKSVNSDCRTVLLLELYKVKHKAPETGALERAVTMGSFSGAVVWRLSTARVWRMRRRQKPWENLSCGLLR